MIIRGYELERWEISNRGYTAKATKGGKTYFLKKYGMFKEPKRGEGMTEKLFARLNKSFVEFKQNREDINEALKELSGEGGNIILPTEWFVEECCYTEVTPFVSGLIEDEQILRLNDEEKLFLMLTAAAALANVHKKGVVHSDLKRTNILAARNPSGRISAKLIDFDMSYFEDRIRPDELGGDQSFMSPELVQCFMYDLSEEVLKNMSTKSDIFSLGLVFHDYLVTEEYKERGKTHIRGCHPQIKGLTGRLKERADKGKTVYCGEALLLPGAKLVVSNKIKERYLRYIIAAMLQPNPEDRPSAQEVRDALRDKKELALKSDAIEIEGEGTGSASAEPAPVAPSDFCAPWPEHAVTFDESKMRADGYVSSEKFEKEGRKYYNLYKSDGAKRPFTVETLIILKMALKKGSATASSTGTSKSASTTGSDIKVYDDKKLWDEDKEYMYAIDTIKGQGYAVIARAEKNGVKGYVLIKPNSEKRFMVANNLKMLGFLTKI